MASGDNQQWGFSQYPQSQASDHGAPQGDYIGHAFPRGGAEGTNINTDSFGLAHQWQTPQDNQFMQQNGFSYQPQGQAYSAQQFSAGNSHTQTHQHPQTFSGSMSLETPSDMSWDYGFGFEANPLANLGEHGGSYGNQLPAASNSSNVPNTPPFPQGMPNTVSGQQPQHLQRQQSQQNLQQPHQHTQQAQQSQHHQQLPQQQPQHPHQHQLNAGHPSGQMYRSDPVAGYGRNLQQPQSMAQTIGFPQPVSNQQHQHQQPHNSLQAGGRPNSQLQSLNQPQQISRVGTPQSVTPVNLPRQTPFSGRTATPMSMQQMQQQQQSPPPPPQQQQQQQQSQVNHHQYSLQDTRGSPAVSFPAPQQTSMANITANISNNPTTQSRFMPAQQVALQQPSQSPIPQANTPALPNVIPGSQKENQLMFQPGVSLSVVSTGQPVSQPRTSTPKAAATAWQERNGPGFEQPRISREDKNAIPVCGSRFVSFAFTVLVPIDPDADANQTILDIADPSEYAGLSLGNLFPSSNGQPRILATQIMQSWANALLKGDLPGQIEQEQRLRQHFGGSIPKRYEDKLHKFKSLYQKSLAKTGPERTKIRPTKEADAAEWDALGIVYLTNPQPTSAEIGDAVAQYGKLIRGHSAEFTKLKVRLKNASGAEEVALKDQISKKLDTIHRAVAAANTWGDPQVVANLGGNQKLVSDFVSCLIYANNTGDHNSQLSKDVLRLMAKLTTIDRDVLMKDLQFAKISKRFESKGDTEVKGFVRAIKENTKTKDEGSKISGSGDERTSTPDSSTASKTPSSAEAKSTAANDLAKKKFTPPSAASVRAPPAIPLAKRSREDDTDIKVVKRIAAEPVNSQISQLGPKAAPSKVVVSAPNTSGIKLFGSGMLGNKTKGLVKPIPKATSVKVEGAKMEASSTKMDLKKDPVKSAKPDLSKAKKSEPLKMEASAASKLGGIGGIGALLDEISNSKPKPPARSTPDRDARVEKDETPEEKARRLRKEKRRHLRVSWKEGEALTEVRLFHKDAGEDEGRASNMIRDARDDRSEGMQLRKANQAQFEDEDEDEPTEEWSAPTGIDFSAIPQNQRSKNSVTRGGLVNFETEQQKLIAEREKTELMVIYTDPTDIPPTPKSPSTAPQEDTEMQTGTVYNLAQDDPKVAEVHLRWAEAGSRGLSWARLTAVRRAQKGQSATLSDVANMQPTQPPINSTAPTPQPRPLSREEQVLVMLTSDRVKNYKDPDPYDPADPKTQRRYDYVDPEVQRAADVIENLVGLMKGKPYPPTEPPEWMKNDTARTAEWWQGYNKDKQRAEQQVQQPVAAVAQPAPVPQPEVAAQPVIQATQQATQADPNTAAWMALAQLQQHAQGQPNAYTQAYQDAYGAAYHAQLQQQQQQQQHQTLSSQTSGDPNSKLQAALATLSAISTPQSQQQSAIQQNPSDPEIQALLASLAQTNAQQPVQAYPTQAAPFQMPASNDPNMLAYIMALAANQTPGQSEQQARLQQQQMLNSSSREHQRDDSRERGSRKRERDRDDDHDGMHPARREKTRGHNKGNRGDIPPHLRGINRDKIGTKPCTFWAKGQCQKGEQCTFRHD